ncbi:MAG: biopolymer transporter ExbD [Crocinitomicaceae bacterium]|nr:biopolymer transporter ExbD [Crocinitomicaceae bacterium]
MAQRDVPEVNAGSMADIAFLLLIFFLVTTTMDKDTAYIRQIPKEVELPPDLLPEVAPRNMFRIKTNKNDELTIASRKVKSENFELLDDPDKISDSLVVWYSANRNTPFNAKFLDPGQTIPQEIQRLVQTTEYPLYTLWTKKYLSKKWDDAEIEIEKAENVNDQIKSKYFQAKQKEYDKRKKYIDFYEKPLLLIESQAHVKIEVSSKTPYSTFVKIHSEIEEALSVLRNKECKNLGYSESYDELKRKVLIENPPKESDLDKIALLEYLFPSNIVEVKPKK